MSQPLLESVSTELHARKGDWPQICTATGLSYWWITKFAQGRIKNPGIKKIQSLADYFATSPAARAA